MSQSVAQMQRKVRLLYVFITFRVRHGRGEMYILVTAVCVSVCVTVCLILATFRHYCTDPDVTWGMVWGAVYLCSIGLICNRCYDSTHVCKHTALCTTKCVWRRTRNVSECLCVAGQFINMEEAQLRLKLAFVLTLIQACLRALRYCKSWYMIS